nr:immunoglobulin light chain junction region [Macaca mulatta]MOW70277.1 immunoglobulin light chain junction region [Macaca mulatta]MOW71265.1 immunoglobulin light chain junction region [Macaca mulatta]MOW72124.1 immunoglobulin light chain junction region [Macaca mulatta]MOW72465.1 immunoglobulin light chain junction region [Macaca mulatta]
DYYCDSWDSSETHIF